MSAVEPIIDIVRPEPSLFWQRLRRNRAAIASAAILVAVTALALLAPFFEALLGIDAVRVDLFNQYATPDFTHWLGTDEAGRDVFVRLLYGGRISLLVGLVAAIGAAVIGTSIGLFAGYHGGRLDTLLMRTTDGVISLPLLPLLIVLAAIDLSKVGVPDSIVNSEMASLYRIVFIIAIVGWTTVARLVRAATLSVRTREFVRAAEAMGSGSTTIMLRHILPNVVSPIIVATTLSIGSVILLESVLSFLGLGIQPPVPSWGNMLTNAQELVTRAPALAVWPGAVIFVTVMAFNFLGDGLQDALDPRSMRR
ncbi:MAG: ABC transporter permease [Alphaproteobacteria bacterium]|nr:ABC transporter permease [Alphaproteobacteria bacterium]